jgi:polyhydroxybutyrate depolymerase
MIAKKASYQYSFALILSLIIGCELIPQCIFAQYDSLNYESQNRTFLVHLPPGYIELDSSLPLILAFHGGFGDAYNMEKMSGLSRKSDTTKNKFIVVYPEGVRNSINKCTWNAGGCCGFAQEHNVDDVGFISILIDTLIERYKINKNKIYASGMSNGGMLCYRLAAELSHKVAAIAPVACSMVLKENWNPVRPIPIIHFHSYLDESIPYYGGIGNGASRHYNPPIDSVLTTWSELNGCVHLSDTLFHETGEYLLREWDKCENESNILCYVTYDGGHSWPGGQKGRMFADPPSRKINASDLMWEFFQQHELSVSTSANSREQNKTHKQFSLHNYPNPFNNFTNIKYVLPTETDVNINIIDIRGRIIQNIVRKQQSAGEYSILFHADKLASGLYFIHFRTHSESFTKKLILLE